MPLRAALCPKPTSDLTEVGATLLRSSLEDVAARHAIGAYEIWHLAPRPMRSKFSLHALLTNRTNCRRVRELDKLQGFGAHTRRIQASFVSASTGLFAVMKLTGLEGDLLGLFLEVGIQFRLANQILR